MRRGPRIINLPNPFREHNILKSTGSFFSSIRESSSSSSAISTATTNNQPSLSPSPSSMRSSILQKLILSLPLIILYSIYLDTTIGGKLFYLRSITQTKLDTQLKNILPKTKPGEKIPPPSAIIPSNPNNVTTVLKPSMGTHRPDQDAVFAIADGLDLRQLVLFIISLRITGYEGDVVLSTWSRQYLNKEVMEFLQYHSTDAGLVVYEGVIIADNENQTMHVLDKEVNGTNVWLKGLYGIEEENEIYHDPRPARSLGVARFELFWAWSLQYKTQSRILLIDAHDTYFQPFGEIGIGVGRTCEESAPTILHLYEESKKLGSVANRANLIEAYREKNIMRFLHNVHVLSPASTHGPKQAMEAYLRAMVQQYDETKCGSYQCEWAFHNYLYYFGVLAGMNEIDDIKTHIQGTGAVNSIGSTFPSSSKENAAMFDTGTMAVLNRKMGHGRHNSWAVHQYRSHPHLVQATNEMTDYLIGYYSNYSKPLQVTQPFSMEDYEEEVQSSLRSLPDLGTHRRQEDAIFTFADGNYDDLSLFVLSARKSGFWGDIVISVPDKEHLEKQVIKFLEFHSNRGVVVYFGYDITLSEGTYEFKLNGDDVTFETAKFEYFYIWSHNYERNQIMLLDGELSYFQSNPFSKTVIDCGHMMLHFYQESKNSIGFQFMPLDNKDIWSAMKTVFDEKHDNALHEKLKHELVLNPDYIFSDQHLLKKFLVRLIHIFEASGCVYFGCDYAAVNYIWYEEINGVGSPISVKFQSHSQGVHLINTGMPASLKLLTTKKVFDPAQKLFLNWNGEISSVVMNYHKHNELKDLFVERRMDLLKEYPFNKDVKMMFNN